MPQNCIIIIIKYINKQFGSENVCIINVCRYVEIMSFTLIQCVFTQSFLNTAQ